MASDLYTAGIMILPFACLLLVSIGLFLWYVYFQDHHQNNTFIKSVNGLSHKIHNGLEAFFEQLGGNIAKFPEISLLVICTICIILSIGLSSATMETDITKLWVTEGNRLGPELKIVKDTWGFTRLEAIVITGMNHDDDVVTKEGMQAVQDIMETFGEEPIDLSHLEIDGISSLSIHDICSETYVPTEALQTLFIPVAKAQKLVEYTNVSTIDMNSFLEAMWRIWYPWDTPTSPFTTPCNQLFNSKNLPKNCSQYHFKTNAENTLYYLYPTMVHNPADTYFKTNMSNLFAYYYQTLQYTNYGPDIELYDFITTSVLPAVLPGAAAYVIDNDPVLNAQFNALYAAIFLDPTFIPSVWRFPCTRFSVIDCFQEGGFDYKYPPAPTPSTPPMEAILLGTFRQVIAAAGLPNPFETIPSFNSLTDDQIKDTIKQGNCVNFGLIELPPTTIVGPTIDTTDPNSDYGAFRVSYTVLSELQLPEKIKHFKNVDITTSQAKEINLEMEKQLLLKLANMSSEYAKSTTTTNVFNIGYFLERSLSDFISDSGKSNESLIIGSIVIMLVYSILTVVKIPSMIKSRVSLATISIALIALSIAAGMGLTCWIGVAMNPITIEVVPLLGLGLGVHGMFVLWAYAPTDNSILANHDVSNYIGKVLSKAGPSCLLTSVCNTIAFFIASSFPIGLVSAFTTMMGFIIVINYFMILFGCTALLAIDFKRQVANRKDVFCCLPPAPKKDSGVESKSWSMMDEMNRFSSKVYAPLLALAPVKLLVVTAFLGFFLFTIYGATQPTVGLPLSDIVQAGSYQAEFLSINNQYFTSWPAYIVSYEDDHTTAEFQTEMLNIQAGITDLKYSYDQVSFPELSYFNGLMKKVCVVHGLLMLSRPDTTDYSTLDGYIMPVGELPTICQTVQNQFAALGIPSHILAPIFNAYSHGETSYIIPSDWYDTYALKYTQTVGVASAADMVFQNVSLTNAKPSPPGCAPSECSLHLVSSRQLFILDGLTDTQSYTDMIKATRAVTNENVDYYMFPYSFAITYWQQYVHIQGDLLTILIITILCVFGAFFIFMLDLVNAVILLVLMIMNILEVYGCLYLGGMKLNAVPLVNLIMAAGVSTEYFARIIYVFALATGSRDQRMKTALSEMFAPVLHGGISTFLGIVLLAASEYTYFRTYYFNMYCLMLIIGLSNGLILLPVVLSLIGANSINNDDKVRSQFEMSNFSAKDVKYARPISEKLSEAPHGSSHDYAAKI